MASRSEQQKRRKKSKGFGNGKRYARFSGATTRFAVRIEERLEHVDEDKTRIKQVEVYVGPASLSRQVVNGTKSSLNRERMQNYYDHTKSMKKHPLTIAQVFNINNSKYQQVWEETSSENKVCFYSNELGRMDMYFKQNVSFFVEVDMIDEVIRRSREYGTANRAKDAYRNDTIRWEETIPISAALPVLLK